MSQDYIISLLSVFHLLFRVGCSSIVFFDIISDVVYTLSDFQYHIRHRIYYIRPPILYQTSDMLYPTSNIISDIRYTISYFQYLYLTSNIILDVKYTISDSQYHIRHQIYYIRLPILISDLQYYSRHQIYIQLWISFQTSYIQYPTSNIISDSTQTIRSFFNGALILLVYNRLVVMTWDILKEPCRPKSCDMIITMYVIY